MVLSPSISKPLSSRQKAEAELPELRSEAPPNGLLDSFTASGSPPQFDVPMGPGLKRHPLILQLAATPSAPALPPPLPVADAAALLPSNKRLKQGVLEVMRPWDMNREMGQAIAEMPDSPSMTEWTQHLRDEMVYRKRFPPIVTLHSVELEILRYLEQAATHLHSEKAFNSSEVQRALYEARGLTAELIAYEQRNRREILKALPGYSPEDWPAIAAALQNPRDPKTLGDLLSTLQSARPSRSLLDRYLSLITLYAPLVHREPIQWLPIVYPTLRALLKATPTESGPMQTAPPTPLERHRLLVASYNLEVAAGILGDSSASPRLLEDTPSNPVIKAPLEIIGDEGFAWLSFLLYLADPNHPVLVERAVGETPTTEYLQVIQELSFDPLNVLTGLYKNTYATNYAAHFVPYRAQLEEGNRLYQAAAAISGDTLEALRQKANLLRQARTAYGQAQNSLTALIPKELPSLYHPHSVTQALGQRIRGVSEQSTRFEEQVKQETARAQTKQGDEGKRDNPLSFLGQLPRDSKREWAPTLTLARELYGDRALAPFQESSPRTPAELLSIAQAALTPAQQAWWNEHMPFLHNAHDLSPPAQCLLLIALHTTDRLPSDGAELIASLRDRLSRSSQAAAVITPLSVALAAMIPQARRYEAVHTAALEALLELFTRNNPVEDRELETAIAQLAATRGEPRETTAEWAAQHFAEVGDSPVLRTLTDLATRREAEIPSPPHPKEKRPARK